MPADEAVTFEQYEALVGLPQRADDPSNDSVYCLTTTCLHIGIESRIIYSEKIKEEQKQESQHDLIVNTLFGNPLG